MAWVVRAQAVFSCRVTHNCLPNKCLLCLSLSLYISLSLSHSLSLSLSLSLYRRVSVNFHLFVGGNNASQGTVDGIEFASANLFCQIYVLRHKRFGLLICSLLPRTPNFNVGNLLWHLRTRFHYTQPHFRPPNRILPNIDIGGRGGSRQLDAKVSWFTLANSIPPTDQEWTKSQK